MGVTVLFYKLFQSKADLAAILKRYCCHGNVTYKFILAIIIYRLYKKCREPPNSYKNMRVLTDPPVISRIPAAIKREIYRVFLPLDTVSRQ